VKPHTHPMNINDIGFRVEEFRRGWRQGLRNGNNDEVYRMVHDQVNYWQTMSVIL
jgi:hypothetical protein